MASEIRNLDLKEIYIWCYFPHKKHAEISLPYILV